jgi:hypothetical protein
MPSAPGSACKIHDIPSVSVCCRAAAILFLVSYLLQPAAPTHNMHPEPEAEGQSLPSSLSEVVGGRLGGRVRTQLCFVGVFIC